MRQMRVRLFAHRRSRAYRVVVLGVRFTLAYTVSMKFDNTELSTS